MVSKANTSGVFVHLHARKEFSDCRKKAGDSVHEIIIEKINQLFSVAEYNLQTETKCTNPSEYLKELWEYLRTTWESTLRPFPITFKSFIYYSAINHIASKLVVRLRFLRKAKLNKKNIFRLYLLRNLPNLMQLVILLLKLCEMMSSFWFHVLKVLIKI